MNHENTLTIVRKIVVNAKVDDKTFATLCSCVYGISLALDLLNSPLAAENPEKMKRYENTINEQIAKITLLGLQ